MGWREFSPQKLNNNSELIFNVCIYVLILAKQELGLCVLLYPGYVNHYFPYDRGNSQQGFLGFC